MLLEAAFIGSFIRSFHKCAWSTKHSPGLAGGAGDTAKQIDIPVHRVERDPCRRMEEEHSRQEQSVQRPWGENW